MGLKNKKLDAGSAVKRRARVSDTLEKALKSFEDTVNEPGFRPTIAEYLKLYQLKRELEQDDTKEIKEIRVTWVEPAATSEPEK